MAEIKSDPSREDFEKALYEKLDELVRSEVAKPAHQAALLEAAKTAAADVVQKAIADFARRDQRKALSELRLDGADMLAHARGLFEYHAGQRLNSIRYFIIAYSLFGTAYFTALKAGIDTGLDYLQLFVISLITFVLTACFWLLDRRNHELVRTDEIALEELEGYAARNHASGPNSSEHRAVERSFNITKNASKGIMRFHLIIQYRYIVRALFFVFFAFSLLVLSITTYRFHMYCGSRGATLIDAGCYTLGPPQRGQGTTAGEKVESNAPPPTVPEAGNVTAPPAAKP